MSRPLFIDVQWFMSGDSRPTEKRNKTKLESNFEQKENARPTVILISILIEIIILISEFSCIKTVRIVGIDFILLVIFVRNLLTFDRFQPSLIVISKSRNFYSIRPVRIAFLQAERKQRFFFVVESLRQINRSSANNEKEQKFNKNLGEMKFHFNDNLVAELVFARWIIFRQITKESIKNFT